MVAGDSAVDAVAPDGIDPGAVRALVVPLYGSRALRTGEPFVDHADGMVEVVRELRADPDLLAAAYLFGIHDVLRDADDWLRGRFGATAARLVADLRQLMRLSEVTRARGAGGGQAEGLRKMLLAMVNDVRVVLLRLASRVQTLRHFASRRGAGVDVEMQAAIARETLELYAPLANRLGVWQLKWELEDLAFRLLEPDTYKRLARLLDEKRVGRERFIAEAVSRLHERLVAAGIEAQISGRPKHIASIHSKMRSKGLAFDEIYDVHALRVIVAEVAQCYQVLSLVHEMWTTVEGEYDDYIARPKPNGYQSLHTVVRDAGGRTLEIQIRTQEMHEFAELGVAAHWQYKEGGRAAGADQQRVAWLRQLLAWRAEVDRPLPSAKTDERIYVLTPQGRVVELPAGATPIDFAYHVHTELGHRCRGARVDGALLPLNRPLANGQTVEIIAAKSGGPSRDWLNADLGYLASARSRQKVRHWFNLLELEQSIASGRAVIERELQRLGRTAVKLDDLARRLGFASVDELSVAASKEEFSLRSVEQALATAAAAPVPPPVLARAEAAATAARGKGGVLVVGVDALMTQMARCCRPVPPDEIVGFVTRGRGVSVHRAGCANAASLSNRHPERLIEVAWSASADAVYPVDVVVLAQDRPGLLRDISEVFAREKLNVVGVNTLSRRGEAQMNFTVEVTDAPALRRALRQIAEVGGVYSARRR
ncbi:MAG: bifunctional (p)ppGpp synthetase/guanosine-3',5'-bis(diphosphate) 3'-pyrophosphohydrolase [Burkholderiales bacterium]|nr:MAG: bifunctional (p)ppGpp synthetase/guanosine-3',5'-bis(diphosphate) 3'-pyrophosphohydrolase [Burkholderiales bacterium]